MSFPPSPTAIGRPETFGPAVALAAYLCAGLVALAATSFGWRWSLDWPRTPGLYATQATATALLFASLLLGSGWLKRPRLAWGGVGGGVVLLLAATAVEPRPLPVVPAMIAGVSLWLIALHRLSVRLPSTAGLGWPILALLLLVDLLASGGWVGIARSISTSPHQVGGACLGLLSVALATDLLHWRGTERRPVALRQIAADNLSTSHSQS